MNLLFTHTKERKETHMIVVVMSKTTLTATQYDNVSNIAYNSGTGTYTITYNTNQTKSWLAADYLISVLFA